MYDYPVQHARMNYRFTGKERDTESGNDYFGARYYASSMGRFLSPDPKPTSGHSADPQTWNRYVYSGNNPLKYIDPDGKEKQLIVYVQQPVPGTRTVSTNAGTNYGHSFIGLRDTATGAEHRFGFYPKNKMDLIGDRSKSVPGTIKNDDKSDWTVKSTYTISDEKFKAVAADINSQIQNAEQYNMQSNNCATWTVNEAGVAGVDLPQTLGSEDGQKALDPGDLGQDLRDRGAQVNPSLDSGNSSGSGSSGSGSSGSGPAPTPDSQKNQKPN